VLAIALMASAVLISTAPATAKAADADILKQCIAARSDESNQEHVRSECMWKHWEQMASWGR
jgi:hypothetical protein